MQEVIVLSYCDACYQQDKSKVEATVQRAVTIAGETAELDFCEPCDAQVTSPLLQLIKLRSGTQRAASRAAAGGVPSSGRSGRRDYRSVCGECDEEIGIRSRAPHTRERHPNIEHAGKITWRFVPTVAEVWDCSCGLTFPTENGCRTHAKTNSHPLPNLTGRPPRNGA